MEIGAKYPMSEENYGYYLGSSYGMNCMGSLHKLEGIMGVEMRERDAWSGTVCFEGWNEHVLNSEDLGKLYAPSFSLELDQRFNCIMIQ